MIADPSDVTYNATQMNMTLTMTNPVGEITEWAPAEQLVVSMNIYQQGIVQIKAMDPSETFSRFRVSDYGVGVEWGQLKPQTISDDETSNPDYLITNNDNGVMLAQTVQVEGEDSWDVQVQYDPFRIILRSNGQVLVVVNN